MILTLLFTILVEGVVVIGYCLGRNKPIQPVLFTSVWANLITQSLLWVVLNIFFPHYLLALLTTEALIWMIETILLYRIPANRLSFENAAFLSLMMNLTSFALGWFLPV